MNTAGSSGGDPLDIQSWMDLFLKELQSVFKNRLVFVGLQGSRGRGEGRPDSDIDAVVVLDRLTPADLDAYEGLLDRLPNRELVCGFVSGREELAAWERSELFQFARDTRPWLGSLDEILPPVERRDIQKAVHAGACGIYHGCAHNLVHDHSPEILRGLFKSALFVLQAEGYRLTGRYIREPDALAEALPEADRALLQTARRIKREGIRPEEMDTLSAMLLRWASDKIITL